MRIVHIATTLEGGAGLCAMRIMSSTRALGLDVRALVAFGERSEFVDVVKPDNLFSRFRLIRYIQILLKIKGLWPKTIIIRRRIQTEMQKNQFPVTFTSPISLYKNLSKHPWVQEADLIHLHWIGDFVDYESFFLSVDKPFVWTAADENPGFGGFHYKMWYENAIDSFKALDGEFALLKRYVYENIKSMTLVAVSTIMKDFFQSNQLLRIFPTTLIYYGLEEDKFFPVNASCARDALGLSAFKKVFLFVAQNINEDRKGLKEIIDALEILNIPNSILVCLGRYNKTPYASFEIRCEGFVGNNRLQSLYFSAADYFIMPSFQESFGQTPVEAMACGTPVVSFPCGISPELINHDNGILCEDYSVDALVKGIKLAMSRNYNREKIREDVINRFSYQKIAKQYLELYDSVLKKNINSR